MSYFESIGYTSTNDFLIRLVLPVLGTSVFFFLGVLFFLDLPIYFPYIILAIGILFTIAYPIVLHERQKIDIHENIHLFITYAGTISTLDIDRKTFFTRIANKKEYGYISQSARKILYLAKSWNLGFAFACRRVAKLSPSKIYSDFLDRFAAIMDFGGKLGTFMLDEQDSMLSAYESQYKQSLNNISMLREVFSAITISMAFGISAALLLPLIMGISMLVVVKWALLALALTDLMLIVLVKNFIPSDDLCSKLKDKDRGVKRIYLVLAIVAPLSTLLIFFLFYFDISTFMFRIAIGTTPFLLVGHFATKEERDVFERDKAFPSFVRAIGSAVYARQGSVASSLKTLRVHDFGVLDEMYINLDRRLRMQSDKLKSWYYFSAETGSNLISYFVNIFQDSVYNGGNAEKIGEIISKNFNRLLGLRTLRQQQASALRGALYGGLVGFIATVYIAVSISDVLFSMFTEAFESTSASGASNLAATLIPTIAPVDAATVAIYLSFLVIIHAFISALTIKIVDGGHRLAFFFDFTLMLWIGAGLSWLVPKVADVMLASPTT